MRTSVPAGPPAAPSRRIARTGRRIARTGVAAALGVVMAAGLTIGAGTASAASTTVVSDADITRDCTATTPVCEFQRDGGTATVVDDAKAQSGTGFLRLDTPAGNDKATVNTTAFAGRKLSEISDLEYRTYIEKTAINPVQAPALNIGLTTSLGFVTLVWEPVYTNTAVAAGSWQNWSPSTSNGGWWASNDVTAPGTPNKYGFATYSASFADVKAAQPDAIVRLVGVNQGGGNPGLTAGVDLFRVNDTTYDFDNPVLPTAIAATSGGGQSAEVGKTFAQPLTATVTGAGGRPVPGAPVSFAVTSGSAAFGSSTTATATTGTNGAAVSPALTAGSTAGPVTVTATSGTLTTTYALTVTPAPAPVPARADLSAALTAPSTATPGKTFTATLTVRNAGPSAAASVASGITVPKGLRITGAAGGAVTNDGRNVGFLTPSIASGKSVTFTVTVSVDRSA
ncbi:MAG: hypothetical protein ABW212_09460, partial [Pseudonocardia sediminis]